MRRVIVIVLSVAAALAVSLPVMAGGGGGGCHDGLTDSAAKQIKLTVNCFGPTVARVELGDTVTWENNDQWQHNVYSQAFVGSQAINAGEAYSYRFADIGIFPYVCTIHPGMMGVVVVGDGASTAAISALGAGATPSSSGTPAVAWLVGSMLIATVVVVRVVRRRAVGSPMEDRAGGAVA